jgi:hypothetical protein
LTFFGLSFELRNDVVARTGGLSRLVGAGGMGVSIASGRSSIWCVQEDMKKSTVMMR